MALVAVIVVGFFKNSIQKISKFIYLFSERAYIKIIREELFCSNFLPYYHCYPITIVNAENIKSLVWHFTVDLKLVNPKPVLFVFTYKF